MVALCPSEKLVSWVAGPFELSVFRGRMAAVSELNEGVWSPQPSLASTDSTEQSSLASKASTEPFLSTLWARC